MPFQSEKQRRYLWANEPEVARKFQKHEPATSAWKSMKDFVSGKTGSRREKERLKPPAHIASARG